MDLPVSIQSIVPLVPTDSPHCLVKLNPTSPVDRDPSALVQLDDGALCHSDTASLQERLIDATNFVKARRISQGTPTFSYSKNLHHGATAPGVHLYNAFESSSLAGLSSNTPAIPSSFTFAFRFPATIDTAPTVDLRSISSRASPGYFRSKPYRKSVRNSQGTPDSVFITGPLPNFDLAAHNAATRGDIARDSLIAPTPAIATTTSPTQTLLLAPPASPAIYPSPLENEDRHCLFGVDDFSSPDAGNEPEDSDSCKFVLDVEIPNPDATLVIREPASAIDRPDPNNQCPLTVVPVTSTDASSSLQPSAECGPKSHFKVLGLAVVSLFWLSVIGLLLLCRGVRRLVEAVRSLGVD